MKQLHIGKNKSGRQFCLPADAVTQTIALLARRGAGKTYAASTIAEEMLEHDQCIVVLDPIGVWWGLRSSANGRAEGYPILVLGGEHADLPLESTAGKTVADFIVGERVSTILDVSAFGENEMKRFVADFASEFYRKNREAVHWFVDEADEFAPQSGYNQGGQRCLGAMQNIVRRGRARGIGATLITQRSAVLNKSVLTQTECLFAMQTTGPHDLKAIEDWLKHHANQDERNKIMGSLTRMQQGEAWVYSPGWLKGLTQVTIRHRRTFDSSATPKPGEKKRSPKKLADVNLGALKDKMSEAVEQAKADDPGELKKEITRLRAELKRAKSAKPTTEVDQGAIDRAVARERQYWQSKISERVMQCVADVAFSRDLRTLADRLDESRDEIDALLKSAPLAAPEKPVTKKQVTTRPLPPSLPSGNGQLELGNSGMRRMLTVLVQSGEKLTASKLALMVGMSRRGGSFGTYLSRLRTAGYVDGDRQSMWATDGGITALGDYEPMPTGRELIGWWQSQLGNSGQRKIFDTLIEAYPNSISRDELARAVEMSAAGGSFGTYLSRLRTLSLIEGSGELKASDVFFV